MKPISGKRMCRVLEGRGWELDCISGGHHVYVHPETGGRIVVPVHGNADLKPGTQHRSMRDAGLTDGDL